MAGFYISCSSDANKSLILQLRRRMTACCAKRPFRLIPLLSFDIEPCAVGRGFFCASAVCLCGGAAEIFLEAGEDPADFLRFAEIGEGVGQGVMVAALDAVLYLAEPSIDSTRFDVKMVSLDLDCPRGGSCREKAR